MNQQGKLAKNSIIYAVFTLLQRGFAFFLIPLYATQLTTSEYGVLGIVMAAIPFFVLIAGASLRGSTAFFYYEYKNSKPDYLKKLWGSSFSFVLILSFVLVGLMWLTKTIFLEIFIKDVPFYPFLFLALLSICTQPAYYYYQSILKAKQLAKQAAFLDFIYFFTIISLTILFILGLGLKAEGALLALAIANMLFFIYSIYGAAKDVVFCIDKNLLRKALKYSLPIIPHNLSAWAMNLADRLILNNLTTLSVVGLFDIGSQIGKLINVVTLGVNSAYSPWFFEQLKKPDNDIKVISSITHKIVLLYVIIATSLSLLAPELIQLISNETFHSAWNVVPFIAFAFVVNGFYYSFSNVFFLEKTKYLPIISFIGAIINIGLNFLLIPFYGIMGAAVACLFSKVIFSAIAYTQSQKLYFIPYNIFYILGVIFIGFILSCTPYILQRHIQHFNIWVVIGVKITFLSLLLLPFFWKYKTSIMLYISTKLGTSNEAKQ